MGRGETGRGEMGEGGIELTLAVFLFFHLPSAFYPLTNIGETGGNRCLKEKHFSSPAALAVSVGLF